MNGQGWWKEPVPLRVAGMTTNVNNTRQAARLLLDEEWGWERETLHAAAKACMEALEGGSDEKAREAFAAAVKARTT
jgi:hypothetical protein